MTEDYSDAMLNWMQPARVPLRAERDDEPLAPNGDHCASDPSDTQGIFFSNRKFDAPPPILDVSPTVLEMLDVPPPAPLDGHALHVQ